MISVSVDESVASRYLARRVRVTTYVPGSKFAFNLRGKQVRYLKVEPREKEKVERIELVKGPDATAPVAGRRLEFCRSSLRSARGSQRFCRSN